MIKKRVIALASLLLAVAVAAALLIVALGESDRSDTIELTSFQAVLMVSGGGQLSLYDINTGHANLDRVLNNGDTIDFSLDWVVKPGPYPQYVAGDTIVIPILTAPGLATFMQTTVPLNIQGTHVGDGTFSKRSVAGGKEQLIFTIAFNAAVEQKVVEGGHAAGSCTLSGTSTSTPLTWIDENEERYGQDGGMNFYKMEANATTGTGYFQFATESAVAGTYKLYNGFIFSIYASQADANNDTNPLSFVQTSIGAGSPRIYERVTAGTTGAATRLTIGGYHYMRLLELDPAQNYWIKEVGCPFTYLPYTAPYKFSVGTNATGPTWYALYNEKNPNAVAPALPPGQEAWKMPNPKDTTQTQPPDLKKSVYGLTLSGENPAVGGDSRHVFAALPDRGGQMFPSFEWSSVFAAMQSHYEANPYAGPTSDVIIEDTITSNLEFSAFKATAAGIGPSYDLFAGSYNSYNPLNSTKTYGVETGGNKSANDFFTISPIEKVFNMERYVSTNLGADSSSIFNCRYIPQSEFTYIVEDADFAQENNKYSSPTVKLSACTPNTSVRDAVTANARSYTVIKNAGGTSTLFINAGPLGQTTKLGDIVQNNVYNAHHNSRPNIVSLEYFLAGNYRSMLGTRDNGGNDYERLLREYAGEPNSHYNTIMSLVSHVNDLFATLAPAYNGGANMNLFVGPNTTINQYPTTGDYTAAYNAAMTNWGSYKTYLNTFLQGGQLNTPYTSSDWSDYRSIYARTGGGGTSGIYRNLYDFLNKLTANHNPSARWLVEAEAGDANCNARYMIAGDIAQSFVSTGSYQGLESAIYYYAYDMNLLMGSYYTNTIAQRDNYLKSALFYYPDLRTELARQLNLPVYNTIINGNPNLRLTASDLSDAALIDAVFQDSLYSKTGTYSGADKYQKWYARLMEIVTDPPANNPALAGPGHYGWRSFLSRSSLAHWLTTKGIQQKDFFVNHGQSMWNLRYRTIMTDTSKPIVGNTIKFTVNGQNYSDAEDFRYRYSAGIYGNTKGGAAFVKADAEENSASPGWDTMANLDAFSGLNKRLADAGFSVYASQQDAANGANPLKFKADTEANTFVYDQSAAGVLTVITTAGSGAFQLIGFPSPSATYWIKEVNAPPGYEMLAVPYGFTVSAGGSEPKYYVLYDEELLPAECSVIISGRKETIGTVPAGETFVFELTQVDDETGAAYTGGTPITRTKSLTSAGRFEFPVITGLTAGEYYFTVREIAGSAPNGHYDDTVYIVKVTAGGNPLTAKAVAGVLAQP